MGLVVRASWVAVALAVVVLALVTAFAPETVRRQTVCVRVYAALDRVSFFVWAVGFAARTRASFLANAVDAASVNPITRALRLVSARDAGDVLEQETVVVFESVVPLGVVTALNPAMRAK